MAKERKMEKETDGIKSTEKAKDGDLTKEKEKEGDLTMEKEKGGDLTGNATEEGDIDRGHAWIVLAATYASFFICGSFLLTSGIVHTALLAKFGQSVAKTGWAGSVFYAAMSLTAPIGSVIIDRYSCRVAVMVGSAMATAGCILTGLAPNVEFCIFSYGVLTGTGGGIVYAVLFVVNGFNFQKRLNLAQGIALSGVGLGLFAVAPLLEASKAEFGYTGLFFVMAGIAMQMIVFGALMRPSSLERKLKRLRNPAQNNRSLTFVQKFRKQVKIYSHALCDAYIILLSISMFFFCGGIYTMFLHWPNFCLHEGFTPMQGSFALSLVGLVSIVGRFGSGIIASLRYVSERVVYSGSMVILGASMILFFLFSETFSGHIAQAVVVGIFSGSPFVIITILNARGVGVKFLASAIGMEFMFGGVGSIVVPVISGYMIQGGFSYEAVFIVSGLCLILAATLGFGTKFVEIRGGDNLEAKSVQVLIVPEKDALVAKDAVETGVVELIDPPESVIIQRQKLLK